MTDGSADAPPSQAKRPGRRANGSTDPADTREYSERLATLARFTLRHKALVIGGVWLGAAVVLALLFPQLETVVRQQSVDLIPRDAPPSLQTVDRMSAAFGEEGSKTMVFVAMEDPTGLTPTARQRYGELVRRLQAEATTSCWCRTCWPIRLPKLRQSAPTAKPGICPSVSPAPSETPRQPNP